MRTKMVCLIYITCKNKKEARKIAAHLMKKRLIACANIFPCTSVYEWNGRMRKHGECVMIAKCSSKNAKRAAAALAKLHPYKLPCIVWHRENSTKAYSQWIEKQSRTGND